MHSGTDNIKHPFICGACKSDLQVEAVSVTEDISHCPSCGEQMHIIAFPALIKEQRAGKAGDALLLDDESGCFYHPGKKAVIPCSSCGRYLCALCDVEINNQHMCPPCIEAGKSGQLFDNMVTYLVRYDKLAFYLAVLPLLIPLFWFFTFITAPAAIYVTIRYWKTPCSLVSGSKIRFAVSSVMSAIQLVFWGFFLFGSMWPKLFLRIFQ